MDDKNKCSFAGALVCSSLTVGGRGEIPRMPFPFPLGAAFSVVAAFPVLAVAAVARPYAAHCCKAAVAVAGAVAVAVAVALAR